MLDIAKRPLAVIDMTEAAEYLEEHAGLDIAIEFLDLCQHAFEQLALTPGVGAKRPTLRHPDTRTWSLRPHPHLVIYRATETTLEILRVIHGARDLDTIMGANEGTL